MGPLGFIIRNFGAIYALVMTAIHAAEEAPQDGTAKRAAAAQSVADALKSIFNLSGKLTELVANIVGGMIDVYVGVRNVLEGHGWFGQQATTTAAAPDVSGYPADQQAHQALNQTDVAAPAPTKPTQPTAAPAKPGTTAPDPQK